MCLAITEILAVSIDLVRQNAVGIMPFPLREPFCHLLQIPSFIVGIKGAAFQPCPPIYNTDVQLGAKLYRLACFSSYNGTNERLAHTDDPLRHTVGAVKKAYEDRERPRGLTFHSDRGSQYTSGTFAKLLEQCSVKQSFSATGRPLDNAVAETFFATFKREEAYRRNYTSEKHFHKFTDSYIQFYNEIRPHQTLNYETPQAFEERYRKRYIEKSCSCGAPE